MDCTLSGRQTVIVAQHLRSCNACRFEVEALKRTKILLHFYASPSPPEGYHDQFGHQLQQTIQQRPRPVWWRTTLFLHALAWRFEEFLNRFIVYAWMLFAVLVSLFAYQFLRPQEQSRFDTVNSRHALSVYPIQSMEGQGNRELISNRGRLAEISQSLPEQFVRSTDQLNKQLDVLETSADLLEWEGHLPSLVSDSDALKAVASRNTSPPDLITAAQLSSPEPIAAIEGFSQPLGVVRNPFPAKIGWAGSRSLNGFVDMLMNVPLHSLSITEVYDAIKL